MKINEEVEKVLNKPVTRKQFLQHVGLIIIGSFGVNALISRLLHPEKHEVVTEIRRGWGNGRFGG